MYQPCSNIHTTTTLYPISILHGAVSFLQWINLHRSIYIILAQILQFTLGFILGDVHFLSLDKCLITCTYYCHIIQNRFTALMILCASHSHCPSPEFSSVAQSCLTLWDPVDCSLPGFPVHHQLSEFAQTHVHWVGDTIQSSHPLSSPSPAFSLSQHQGLFQWVTSHQVAKGASASVLLMNIQDWFPLGLTGLIFLQSKGLRVFSNTTVQKVNSLVLSFLYGPPPLKSPTKSHGWNHTVSNFFRLPYFTQLYACKFPSCLFRAW